MALDLRGSDVRIRGLPDCPIVEVLDGLLDGCVRPERWALPVVLTGLHEVMEDPGGLGLAHGITRCEVREFPRNEPRHPAFLKLLGPTGEVFLRVQGVVLIVEGIAEVLDALLLVLDVLGIDGPRVVLVMLLEDLVG